ncbi:MAG: hypothetical protein FJX46_07250 [Alphaproteobacteria bacterium]|nr:hypothetical protein [Alphaproteobacteria bacterium]
MDGYQTSPSVDKDSHPKPSVRLIESMAPSIQAARLESQRSDLPGVHNGPADAYRHVLWAAELTRIHGENAARTVLDANEWKGDKLYSQSPNEKAMDLHNNEIGIKIGREAKTFDEIVVQARERIDAAARGETGDGVPVIPPSAIWSSPEGNWPPQWKEPDYGKYDRGGEEHRHRDWRDSPEPADMMWIMAQAPESLTAGDIDGLMASDAYWRGWDPDHQAVREMVSGWHQHFYGDGPVERDAEGRIKPKRDLPTRHGGAIAVRAYTRGQVAVRAHTRAAPG